MSERYQRATDILELKDLLQTTLVGLTMNDVAENFDVSRRTAERMIGALRDRFKDVQAETRDGRKYWSLRTSANSRPDGLPADLEELTHHVDESFEGSGKSDRSEAGAFKRADALFENSTVGIFLLDVDFKIVWINRAIERYFGTDREEVIGFDLRTSIRDMVHGIFENPLHFEQRVLATYADNSYIEHFRCHVLPGEGREERWLEHWSQPIEAGPFKGGRIEHYVDVTQSVRADEARRHELRALRGRFQDADASVKAAGVANSIAYAIVDPLTNILAIANNPAYQGADSARAEALEEISGLATRIGESLHKMLELTNCERPRFESLKAKAIMESAVREVLPSATQSGIDIEVAVSSHLENFEFEADSDLLVTAMEALLKNAVEAMPAGGTLWLVGNLSDEAEQICFCVSDTGPGIRRSLQRRVLAPFFTTRKNATGLGLGIAQAIAELHGGQIEIETANSGGAKVSLKLPVRLRAIAESANQHRL